MRAAATVSGPGCKRRWLLRYGPGVNATAAACCSRDACRHRSTTCADGVLTLQSARARPDWRADGVLWLTDNVLELVRFEAAMRSNQFHLAGTQLQCALSPNSCVPSLPVW